MQRLFTKILNFQLSHPVAIVVTALLLTLLSILYTVRNLEFQTGQMDLIYPDNPLVKLSEEIKTTIDYDTFIVVIENRDVSRSLAFLHALAPILEKDSKHYSQVFYRINPAQFKPWALFYMDREGLLTLRQNLREHETLLRSLAASPGLTTLFEGINREMASSMVDELFTGFLDQPAQETIKDPMDLTFVIRTLTDMKRYLDTGKTYVSPWQSVFTGDAWNRSASDDGYFWTKEKRCLLLFVTPKSTDSSFSDKLDALKQLRANIARLQKTSYQDIQAGVTGQEALNQDEMSTAFRDISIATIISLVGLAILLIVFWRGIRYPFLELTELIIALSWTFGLTTLFIGHLNILSITFAPLLLGLGIDYGIHWLARYQEEKQQMGLTRQEALRATMLRLGPSILLAGLTAACSFFPLILTGFKGLVELGEIASMGMVTTTVTTLCLLPSLITLFDRRQPAATPPSVDRHPRNLFRITNRAAVPILLAAVLGFGLSLEGAGRISFDLNMLNLQSKGAESVTWEHKLLNGSDQSSMYGVVLANSLEDIREKSKALTALPAVSGVQSVLSMLPENQKKKTEILQGMSLLLDNETVDVQDDPVDVAELNTILGRIRFKMLDTKMVPKQLAAQMDEVRDLIDAVRERFRTLSDADLARSLETLQERFIKDLQNKLETLRLNINAQPMQAGDLPLSLRERYILPDGRYIIRVFPTGNIWNPAVLSRFVAGLRSVDSNAIGDPVTLDIFTRAFRDGCIKAAVYAVVFIVVLLLLTFRNLYLAFLVLTPLIMGTVWTLGLMDLCGVGFNLANSLFLPLIVGAGVEYGIIILQRRRQDGVSKDGTAIPLSTAKGVILAGLTTAMGFGSLIVAHHQGIASLGLLAMIGSLSILIAAIIFLPALMQVTEALFARRKATLDGRSTHSHEQTGLNDQDSSDS